MKKRNSSTSTLNTATTVSSEKKADLKKIYAWQDSHNEVILIPEQPLAERELIKFQLRRYSETKRARVKIKEISAMQSNDSGITKIKIITEQNLEVYKPFLLEHESFVPTVVKARLVLNNADFMYSGKLGCTYSTGHTSLSLWAPTAALVEILLFTDANTADYQKLPMKRGEHGEWNCTLSGDRHGYYYLYAVHFEGIKKSSNVINVVADPYSAATSPNSKRSMIYNPDLTSAPIENWDTDQYVTLANNTDAILYEVHVRDMTISKTSGCRDEWRGKFLGLSENETTSGSGRKTGLSHLIELGITHLHLMPVFDYATGNEAEDSRQATWYNWGYDPMLYNNLEGSYAVNPHGCSRQKEFKQLVATLHRHNIGVVCDVVYNHTYHTGNGELSVFDKIVPDYYYRLDDYGNYINGSGCGNDIASERPMVRKFIVDSCKFWTEEYHIDGLRFDLMGLIDRTTMEEVYQAVKAINPNAIIYGEGWNIPTGIPDEQRTHQYNVRGTGIAAFNDGYRDSLKGDVFKQKEPGFIQGAHPYLTIWRLMAQIKGQETGRSPVPIEIVSPNETINYVSAHDNACLWDKLAYTNPQSSIDERKRMVKFAAAILLTSQGVPFLSEGDDFCRSKQGNDNSYNNNDPLVNPINWETKNENYEVFEYFRGLIALRKAHPAFRIFKRENVDRSLHIIDRMPENVIAYFLFDHANQDSWSNIFVCYNGNSKQQNISLPGNWNIVVNDNTAGIETLTQVTDVVTVAPLSALIAWH